RIAMPKEPSKHPYSYTDSVDLANARRLPARLTIDQVGFLLNFQTYEIKILLELGYLKCLGTPNCNSRKLFSAQYIESLSKDVNWLHTATRAVSKSIQAKNKRT